MRAAARPARRRRPECIFLTLDVTGAPPGDYKVFAMANLPAGGPERNASFIARYEEFGVPVTVVEGQTIEIDVDFISVQR